MIKRAKGNSRKLNEINENRKNRRFRKKFKVDEAVKEVKQVIVTESEEDQNISSGSEENFIRINDKVDDNCSDENDVNKNTNVESDEDDDTEEVKQVIVTESEEDQNNSSESEENFVRSNDKIDENCSDENDENKNTSIESDEDDNSEEIKQVIVTESEDQNISSESEENFVRSNNKIDENCSDENDGNKNTSVKSDDYDNTSDSKAKEKVVKKRKAPRRKRRKTNYNAAEEARLERLVFGDSSDVIKNLLERDDSTKKNNNKHEEKTWAKLSDDSDDDDFNRHRHDIENDECNATKNDINSAWVDDDDIKYSIETALKEQHRKFSSERPEKVYTELLQKRFTEIVGTPKWASLEVVEKPEGEDTDSDNEILKHSSHLTVPKVKKLRKGKIDIKALTDINKSTHTEGPIVTSLQFHPTSTVAMVGGLSGILSLFQIDGKENTKLQSIRFEKFRINCGKFLKEGNEIILGSRNCSFSQAYDLITGKTYKIPLPHGITNMQKFEVSPDGKFIAVIGKMGQIHLLSSTTKELVANFKMNNKCLALAFSPDSQKLITHGESDEMYIWDLNNRSCIHKAIDDGCLAGSAVVFSPSGQFLATGSKQGVVNVYDTETVMREKAPIPLKIIMNLVTPISNLKFNPTSEILGMASKFKENALKMLHLPSFTVFANFPTFQTKMYNPLEMDFSPSSGYLGLTNNNGHAYLYRLKHYGNY